MYRPASGHEHWRPRKKVIYKQLALGYDELDAQLWASTVMAQLQITEGIGNLVGQIANDEPSLIPSPVPNRQRTAARPMDDLQNCLDALRRTAFDAERVHFRGKVD